MLKYNSSTKPVPQYKPIPGRKDEMVLNDAGGYVFKIDPIKQLKRFLVLGSSDGTYYVSKEELTERNMENIIELIKLDGKKVIDTIMEFKDRVPKLSPSLYTLALVLTYGDIETKKYGYSKISQLCKTSFHLFEFMTYVQNLRGWSRGLRNGVSEWFSNKNYENLRYQFIKYRQREGWTHRDILRLAHVKILNQDYQNLFKWAVGKMEDEEVEDYYIKDFIDLQNTKDEKIAIDLIDKNKFTWEMVPTELLNSKKIWKALLPNLPLTAMLRNLGKMASIELLKPFSNESKYIVEKLTDKTYIELSKVHPYQIALSLVMYNNEKGFKGSLSWESNTNIIDALETAYKFSYINVQPINKNILVGLDVSGSMTGEYIHNSVLTADQASKILALVHANTESNIQIIDFDVEYYKSKLNKNDKVIDAINKHSHGGGTDLSLPIKYAFDKNIPNIDAFIIYTDNETWYGNRHTSQLFNEYRKKYNKNCKIVVVSMTATSGSIIDPKEQDYMLEVVGFDTNSPNIINDFILGKF